MRGTSTIRTNEHANRNEEDLEQGCEEIRRVMFEAVHRGCRAGGVLPGGLDVHRRAPDLIRRVTGLEVPRDEEEWYRLLADTAPDFARALKLVGDFSIAVNGENAAFGRIVTAPTNGSAGVIPADRRLSSGGGAHRDPQWFAC